MPPGAAGKPERRYQVALLVHRFWRDLFTFAPSLDRGIACVLSGLDVERAAREVSS